MKLPIKYLHQQKTVRGFTIIEILAVLVIVVTLMAVSVPAISSLLESNNLTRSGQMLADQIGLARQIAAAKNKVVEVRLVKSDSSVTNGYSSIQIWVPNESGVLQFTNKLALFPKGIVISEQPSLSAVFNPTTGISGTNTMPTSIGSGSNFKYAAFQIRPSGMVIPSLAMTSSTLTVVSIKYASNTTLPKNYVTIQVNPMTATPLVYRP